MKIKHILWQLRNLYLFRDEMFASKDFISAVGFSLSRACQRFTISFLLYFVSVLLLPATNGYAVDAYPVNDPVETSACCMFLLNDTTGDVLLEKDADKHIPPASLAKLMTIELIFKALKEGTLTEQDMFHVSKNAWLKGGARSHSSTMFAEYNSKISLDNLLKGIIVQSGNDACITVAEGMAGNEKAFVALMNARARELDLHDTHFMNSTGLPAQGQYISVRDMAKLAHHIIRAYPDMYWRFGQTEFRWNNIIQHNRNPLLGKLADVDGLKTGYTVDSGYAFVASALHRGQRIILVLTGLPSSRKRYKESKKIIEWAYWKLDHAN